VLGREIGGIHPDLAGVTVDQLLRHRSGLLARGPSEVWTAAQRAKGPAEEQRRAYVEAMITKAPAKPAGQYQYSNAGYAVLGMMAETVAGKPYEELLQERVLKPLGITTAGFGQAGDVKSVAAPWGHLDGGPTFTDNPPAVAPGMTLHMSIGDWAKFANFELGHQPTPPLLKPETFNHLQELSGQVKDDEMGYACGWFRPLRSWAGGRALHHVGSNTVNFSEIWLAPSKDFGVLVCSNEGSPDAVDACEAACTALIQRFLGVNPGPLDSARDRRNPVSKPKG
jgi:CubicO group peptidase (beta-lactamase class C family)